MNFPLLITFNDPTISPAIELAAREKFVKLGTYCAQIQGCYIAIDSLHQAALPGKLYLIRVSLNVAGEEFVVNGKSGEAVVCNGICTAMKDAFDSARSLLQGCSQCRIDEKQGHHLLPCNPQKPLP